MSSTSSREHVVSPSAHATIDPRTGERVARLVVALSRMAHDLALARSENLRLRRENTALRRQLGDDH